MKYENSKIQKSFNSKNWLITWWICQTMFIIIEIIDKKCKSTFIIYWWSQWSLYLVRMLQNILCYIISLASTPYNGISNIIIIYHHIIVLYIYLCLAQPCLNSSIWGKYYYWHTTAILEIFLFTPLVIERFDNFPAWYEIINDLDLHYS